ncbi:hypothetical protein ACET3Z_000923 [Daucus carota]
MALGKYSRLDGRKSPTSYCSTATFVVFIGLCLVGVWMMTSSSIVPVENMEETAQELKTEIKESRESEEASVETDKKSESDSNIIAEIEKKSESDTSSESNTSGEMEKNSEADTSSEKNTSTESSTGSESITSGEENTSSEGNRSDESNTSNEGNKDSKSDASSENNTNESKTSGESDKNSENISTSENNANSENNSNNESKMSSSNLISESNTSTDTSSNSESNTSSESKPYTETNASSESNTASENSESNTGNDNNSNSESKADTEANTSIESNTDSENNASSEKNSDSESNTSNDNNSSSESSTKDDSNSDSGSTESNTNSESNTDIESGSGSSAGDESSTSNKSQPRQFDDNPGNLPEDATKGDNVTVTSSERNSTQPETTYEQHAEGSQEQKPENQSGKEDTNASKSETGNVEDRKEDKVSDTEDKESKDGGKNSGINEKNWVYGKSISGGKGEEEAKVTTSKSDEGDDKSEMSNESGYKDKMDSNSTEIHEKEELLLSGAHSELLNQTVTEEGAWKTQVAESKKETHKSLEPSEKPGTGWKLCNATAGPDYIPCLDNMQAIKSLPSTKHYEHRERHCPDDLPTCLVPLPEGYQRSVEWPTSRDKIWYHNVPHTKLADIKGHQNWVKFSGDYLTFPGGGTQFKHGALHYIDIIQQIAPAIDWGKRSRVVLDVGCGVASFGGFLFDRDALTMSFAPKDEHEAQVQFALERGIPAFLAVMGTKRLPFPGKVFDVVHCARCRVPWHIEGGKLLLELNRLLRPGGYFVWSATPIYRVRPEDVQIWEAMKKLAKEICWELITIGKDTLNEVGLAVFKKPSSNKCYESRALKKPPLCSDTDDPNASWNVPLQVCMHKIPENETERGSRWPEQWPARLEKPPYWLLSSQVGVYGKPAPDDFVADYEHWKRVVSKSYVSGLGINWSTVRNVMDMRAVYGGFAAALRELNVWVMNVVNVDAPDTLPIIYERGLFGMYHDWCESFSTYPRTYDLIHADHLFSKIKKKCNFEAFVVEVDRILRPEGKLIVRDNVQTIKELETMFKSMQWEVYMSYAKDQEGLLCLQKSIWRPHDAITLSYAIA